jgi:hypothetical protein
MITLSSRSKVIETMAILLSLLACLFFAANSLFAADVQPQIPLINGELDLIYEYVIKISEWRDQF